jgi:hypothetical protein
VLKCHVTKVVARHLCHVIPLVTCQLDTRHQWALGTCASWLPSFSLFLSSSLFFLPSCATFFFLLLFFSLRSHTQCTPQLPLLSDGKKKKKRRREDKKKMKKGIEDLILFIYFLLGLGF